MQPGLPLRPITVLWLLAMSGGCGGFGVVSRTGQVKDMVPVLPDHCGIAALPPLTGQPMTTLADYALQGPLRVVWPAQEVTSEVQAKRLNAQVDDEARILRLFCG